VFGEAMRMESRANLCPAEQMLANQNGKKSWLTFTCDPIAVCEVRGNDALVG
jgi:hypothetical protein